MKKISILLTLLLAASVPLLAAAEEKPARSVLAFSNWLAESTGASRPATTCGSASAALLGHEPGVRPLRHRQRLSSGHGGAVLTGSCA